MTRCFHPTSVRCAGWSGVLGTTFLALSTTTYAQSTNPSDAKPAPHALPAMPDVKTPHPANPDGAALPLEARPARTTPTSLATKDVLQAALRHAAEPRELTSVLFDRTSDGAVWVLGQTYKAEFDARGATYVPFFGSDAPRNFPVAMKLESVTVGGDALALGTSAVSTLTSARVELDRGGVVERYDVGLASIEQSFVFQSLPRIGELSVQLAVATELEPRATSAGIEFANDYGFVRYGKATAFDANGRTQPLVTTWTGDGLRIDVPAAFLAAARFPVTIDPVIATFSVDASTAVDTQADIAFEETSALFAISWERVFSATDHDVWIEEWTVGGTPVLSTRATIDFTTTSWEHPRIAANALSGQFLVVAQSGVAPARVISGRTMESESPYAMSAQFQISDVESGDKSDPDVGGDPVLVGPTYYCVVWTRDFAAADRDVHSRLVQTSGTLLGLSTILIDNSGGSYDVHPSVSKSDGPAPFSNQDWNVAWEREAGGAGGEGDILGAQVHWDGTITTPSFLISTGPSNDEAPSASPGIDYAGVRNYLVTFTRDFTSDRDIEYVVLAGASTTLGITNLSSQENNGLLFQDQVQPQCEATDQYFHVVYSEQFGASTTDYDVYATKVYFNGATTTLAEAHLNLAFSFTRESNPQIASRRSGGALNSPVLGVAWEDSANGGDIEGATTTNRASGPIVSFCAGDGSAGVPCPCAAGSLGNGCPNSVFPGGANLSATGNASVANDTLVLIGTGMPNANVLYFQGESTVAAFVIDDGIMCTGAPVIRLGTKLNAANASQYPVAGDQAVSIRGSIPAAAGVTRIYQAFYRNAANFCTPATSNRTNALSVLWLP
ncbi:MAG: hypothetical protein IPJ77_14835 [Planctomycetes bacterium]|nr:hypothetical protein [Planctomycetota bacterium]